MIPKIIHLCWLSGDAFPDDIRKCLDTWKVYLKDYEIWLWGKAPDDCLGLNVVEKHFDLDSVAWTKEAYEARKYAFAADYIRLYALYNFGGIYLDADVIVYKPFDDLLELPYFIGCDQIRAFEAAVIGAQSGCKWIKDMLDSYEGKNFIKEDGSYDVMELPVRFHHELTRLGYKFYRISKISQFVDFAPSDTLQIFAKDYFNSRNSVEVEQTKMSYCGHNYAGSWNNSKNKSLKDRLPKCVLKIIYTVGQATWARNKYAWFQIPFEIETLSLNCKQELDDKETINKIPKLIHYCWFGGNPLPPLAKECIASWRKYLPNYKIIQWSESSQTDYESLADEVREFDVSIIPYTAEAYKQKKYAFVSDYARFWIMYKYGGLYFDTDVEVIKPLDSIIAKGNFMGFELDPDGKNTPGKYAPRYCFAVALGLGFGMVKEHPFMKNMMQLYSSLHFELPPADISWYKTIVAYTTEILCAHGLKNVKGIQQVGDINVYPHEYFAPINVVTGRLKITDNTYAIHRYMGSWNYGQHSFKDSIRKLIPDWAFIYYNKVKRRRYKVK